MEKEKELRKIGIQISSPQKFIHLVIVDVQRLLSSGFLCQKKILKP